MTTTDSRPSKNGTIKLPHMNISCC